MLELSLDEVLSTTRAVRQRLDLTRPVKRELIEECVRLAQQAPTGASIERWHFVVVTDPAKKAAIAELYRSVSLESLQTRTDLSPGLVRSARYLAEHLHEVPVHVIPCVEGRGNEPRGSNPWGSILPATWSFMLAARARGLGTAWTTAHLRHEQAVAELLGIPYDEVMQAALIPVAYSLGTGFRPSRRKPLASIVHWEGWPAA
jgi:nitroreductase